MVAEACEGSCGWTNVLATREMLLLPRLPVAVGVVLLVPLSLMGEAGVVPMVGVVVGSWVRQKDLADSCCGILALESLPQHTRLTRNCARLLDDANGLSASWAGHWVFFRIFGGRG